MISVRVYRARASIHRGLVKLLSHGEGDVGGADRCRRFDGKRLPVLCDLNEWLGGRLHGNHTQHHVHT